MPHEIAVDEAVNCYFVRWTGEIEAAELRAFYYDLARLPWFRSGLNCLADMRQASFRTSASDRSLMIQLQRLASTMFGTGRVATVVSDQQTYNYAISIDSLTGSPERPRKIFRDYEAARAWLGLPVDYVSPLDGSG